MNFRRKIIISVVVLSLLMLLTVPVVIACNWCIEKSANVSELTLATGQQHLVTYTINLTQIGVCDLDYPTSAAIYDTNFHQDPPYAKTCSGNSAGYFDYIVCVPSPDGTPITFTRTYTLFVGPYYQCGDYTAVNTACLPGWEPYLGECASSSQTIAIHVPCEGGCTLTSGYWKTHSKYGPAPYDDTWAEIGEDTTFYLSVETWYQVLWKPRQGNAYYILAFQYIAAKLNLLNEASSTPQIDAVLAWADNFFKTYYPSSRLGASVRNMAISYASLLNDYNNGDIGPGHCSE